MDNRIAVAINARHYLLAIGGRWKGDQGAGRQASNARKSMVKSIRKLWDEGYSVPDVVAMGETHTQRIVIEDQCKWMKEQEGSYVQQV